MVGLKFIRGWFKKTMSDWFMDIYGVFKFALGFI